MKEEQSPFSGDYMGSHFRSRFKSVLDDVIGPNWPIHADEEDNASLSRLVEEFDVYGMHSAIVQGAFLHAFPDKQKDMCTQILVFIESSDDERVKDGIWGAYAALRAEEDISKSVEVAKLLQAVILQIKWRRQAALAPSLRVLLTFVAKRPELVSKCQVNDLLIGLKHIAVETDWSETKLGCNTEETLELKKLAAALAFALFARFSQDGKDIPDALLTWKQICQSPDEFAEVRNQWGETEREMRTA